MDDISQQELKNAVCLALTNRKALDKSSLIKETVSVMGFNRSGAKLVDAIERGLKYGRKTGEIVLNEDGMFMLRPRSY